MKEISIVLTILFPVYQKYDLKKQLNWCIKPNEQWAIIGPNGAGKSIIAGLLQGKYALKEGEIINNYPGKTSDVIKTINFQRHSFYYRQSYNFLSTTVAFLRE